MSTVDIVLLEVMIGFIAPILDTAYCCSSSAYLLHSSNQAARLRSLAYNQRQLNYEQACSVTQGNDMKFVPPLTGSKTAEYVDLKACCYAPFSNIALVIGVMGNELRSVRRKPRKTPTRTKTMTKVIETIGVIANKISRLFGSECPYRM